MNTNDRRIHKGIVLVLMAVLMPIAAGAATSTPAVENATNPESTRPALPRIRARSQPVPQVTGKPTPTAAPTASSGLGPNLIQNPSVETAGSGGVPSGWSKGGYGANTRVFTYPAAPASDGAAAIGITVSGYSSGDAKWFFTDVPVTAGDTYEFSDSYQASVPSIVTARFRHSDGSFSYADLKTLPANASYQSASVRFTAPAGATSLTVFHLIKQNGTIVTDDYSLNRVTPPSGGGTNLVPNGDMETAGSGDLPLGWGKGGWGTNTRAFTYPVTTLNGSRAAQVTVSNYTSGDAKWHFAPLALPAGSYTYSDDFQSSVPSYVTVQMRRTDGTFAYQDLAVLPVQASPGQVSANFTVPAGIQDVTVFHLIKQNGTLTIDNVAIRPVGQTGGGSVFDTGGVSLRFDDGWRSHYDIAAPKMNAAGLKGTFYIVTRQMADTGFPGYISVAEVQNLAAQGHEIGAHTRTHAHLTSLTIPQRTTEIAGSRQDLLSWNVGPIMSFSYPFGEYDAATMQIVQDAGFSSAAATINGDVTLASDPYQLERRSVENTTTLAQVQTWIQNAMTQDRWLVLTFHQIAPSCADRYCATTAVFNGIVDYLDVQDVPVVTVSQGAQALQ